MKKIPKLPTDLCHLEWSEYPNDKLSAAHPDGFVVIIPKDYEEPVPLFCPVCGCSQATQDDVQTCVVHGCCSHCYQKWAYSHREDWKNGWRPTISSCSYKKTITVGE